MSEDSIPYDDGLGDMPEAERTLRKKLLAVREGVTAKKAVCEAALDLIDGALGDPDPRLYLRRRARRLDFPETRREGLELILNAGNIDPGTSDESEPSPPADDGPEH